MATATTNPDGLPAGAPSIQQLDSLPSRLQVASGIRTGTVNQATAAIQAALQPADAVALQASDAIQTAIEDGMTAAANVAQLAVNQAMTAIENLLAPLIADIQANMPRKRKNCNTSSLGTTGVSPPTASPPPPAPLGCIDQLAPPGSGLSDQIVCQPPGDVALFGETAAQIAVRPLPIPPPPPPGSLATAYSILVNCKTQQAAAAPHITDTLAQQLPLEGWQSYAPNPFYYTSYPADALAYLDGLRYQFASLCLPIQ